MCNQTELWKEATEYKRRTTKKNNKKSHLALRTVYLSRKLDDQLCDLAFRKKKSINDLLRQMIHDGLNRIKTVAQK